MLQNKKRGIQRILTIMMTLQSIANGQLSFDLEIYKQCLVGKCQQYISPANEQVVSKYSDCIKAHCTETIKVEEQNKEQYSQTLQICFNQCQQVDMANQLYSQCDTTCISDTIAIQHLQEKAEDSSFHLNTFLIAVSVILGIIILFLALIKWAYIRKRRMNNKLRVQVSPQIVTSIPTAIYPIINLNKFTSAEKTLQGIPCKEDNIYKLAIFQVPPFPLSNTDKPISFIFDKEVNEQNQEIYYPGQNVQQGVTSCTNTENKQDVPVLQIAQIQINDNNTDNQEIWDNLSPKQDVIVVQKKQIPIIPLNVQFNSKLNNIHINNLNLSKLLKQKKKKISEVSTLTNTTGKNDQTSSNHQRLTSRCEFQNFLLEKSPTNYEQNSIQLNMHSTRHQQLLTQKRNQKQIKNARFVSSKSFSKMDLDAPTPQAFTKTKLIRRKSFNGN